MAIPTYSTVSAGGTLTAALWNSNIRDAGNFYLGVPHVILTQGTIQAIATGTFTGLLFDVEVRDNDGVHSTVTNTSRITCVTAGWYEFGGNVGWAANASALSRRSRWAINGTAVNGTEVTSIPITGAASYPAKTDSAFLTAGDYLELHAFQDTGANLNTAVTGAAISRVWAKWVGQ